MSSTSQRRKRRKARGIIDDNDPRKFYQGNCYERFAMYPVDQILPLIGKGNTCKLMEFDVGLGSQRLLTFKSSIICASCGKVSQFFALEKQKQEIKNKPHLNLYAIDDEGNEVLMTKDHIIPRSAGGSNSLSNLQTMCHSCNIQKSDTIQP